MAQAPISPGKKQPSDRFGLKTAHIANPSRAPDQQASNTLDTWRLSINPSHNRPQFFSRLASKHLTDPLNPSHNRHQFVSRKTAQVVVFIWF
ncbi:MAG: hypothetical protein NTU84_10625, partial [Verrucomicrobia bacterium]|nr:hypothetical protein [Verrucomicrobiota bacterium]